MHSRAAEILDCTLRDGGYYTLWDFSPALVEQYLDAISRLPISTIELGYCNIPRPGYYGQYYYLTPAITSAAKETLAPTQRLAVMLDEKTVVVPDLERLLSGHRGIVDIVRIAVAPTRLRHAAELGAELRRLGFAVAINIMYLSKYWEDLHGLAGLAEVTDVAETVALVDSYGACTPDQVYAAIRSLREIAPRTRAGFHGHDNLGLAVANSLQAIEAGADVIDSTMTGMGRGPGNTRSETLLVQQASSATTSVDYTALADAVSAFAPLQSEHQWGTNLVYMISGAAGLPQNNVMDWLAKNRYSIPAIIHALQGAETLVDATSVPDLSPLAVRKEVLILGGGPSITAHLDAIRDYVAHAKPTVIHATSKHLSHMPSLGAGQYIALAGDAPLREPKIESSALAAIIVPAGPRFDVPAADGLPLRQVEPYLPSSGVDHLGPVSDIGPLALALGAAKALEATTVTLAGFDGYDQASVAQQELAGETQALMDAFCAAHPRLPFRSATRTRYEVPVMSIYALLAEPSAVVL